MSTQTPLPQSFLQRLRELEESYLQSDDPILQSGFGGGAARWRAEREPILDAVDEDGDFLDVGCANGYLLECLVAWARERGRKIAPYGVDIGPQLIELARRRLPEYASHFYVANAWEWEPPRRFRYVYTLLDLVPEELARAYVQRLLERAVEPGGRLIAGDYGSHSRSMPGRLVAEILTSYGLQVSGSSTGGEVHTTRFAWVERP